MMSALHPKADLFSTEINVCYVPKADLILVRSSFELNADLLDPSIELERAAIEVVEKYGTSLDEFPAIGTGNFLLQTGKSIATNNELRTSACWRERDIVAAQMWVR